jgi:replicative DNA helicase
MVEDLKFYKGIDEVVHVKEIIKQLDETHYNRKIIHSGMPCLDEVLSSFSTGEVVVLSGPPGHGKTSFARFLLSAFSERECKPMYFGMEGLSDNFFQKFNGDPDFYMSRELIKSNIQWLKQRMLESKAKYGTDIAVIDHLHYIADFLAMSKENTSLFIGQLMRDLVFFAVEHDFLIILLAHTTKSVFVKAPGLGDIRDSSFIAQEASVVMFIYRRQDFHKDTGEPTFYENQCKLSIQKNRRNGKLITLKLRYDNGRYYPDTDTY